MNHCTSSSKRNWQKAQYLEKQHIVYATNCNYCENSVLSFIANIGTLSRRFGRIHGVAYREHRIDFGHFQQRPHPLADSNQNQLSASALR